MISNCAILMLFGFIAFAGGVFAKHPPGLFSTRFETPEDFYNDESAFNERKYQEQHRVYQSNWPWANAFDNEFIKDHQAVTSISKIDADDGNLSDFPEYSTEHLPIPQALIQNYIKGKTAKKNSNHFAKATYMSLCHFKICNICSCAFIKCRNISSFLSYNCACGIDDHVLDATNYANF